MKPFTGAEGLLIGDESLAFHVDLRKNVSTRDSCGSIRIVRQCVAFTITGVHAGTRPRPVRLARAVWSHTPSAIGVANPHNEGGAVCDELCV